MAKTEEETKQRTESSQEQPMRYDRLENIRYWKNYIPPRTDRGKPQEEGRLPDCLNPKRLKELH
ncbi:MAG: hypothetical protein J6A29_02120 [Clostridia bacterium]|nr:hypothetical protein [Clostridia bacterium]